MWRILSLLGRHGIVGSFYVLGHVAEHSPKLVEAIGKLGHRIGSHGYWHRHGECEGDASDQLARKFLPEPVEAYRSPFWDTTPCPGRSGGVYFRLLPYGWLKREVKQSGILWLHPHDLYPQSNGPLRRRLWRQSTWNRLDRLLTEVRFA